MPSKSYLGDGSSQSFLLSGVAVGAEFAGDNGLGGLAHGSDLGVAVVVVNDVLNSQSDRGDFGGKSGDTDFSIDRSVGISAVVLGAITAISGGVMVSKGHQGQQGQDENLYITISIYEKLLSKIGLTCIVT